MNGVDMEKDMKEQLVSVVIPIYKVEEYLPACVDSVLSQTYRNLEVILVDDGSPDRCPEIADQYAKLDKRVRVIHQKNGGLSAARNSGLQIATGEFITFIDSDDYISPEYVEVLCRAAEECDADISICDYRKVTDADRLSRVDIGTGRKIFSNIDCLKETYCPVRHGMEFIACAKLYRRCLFQKYQILYPVGKLHEDVFTTYQLMYYSDRIVWCDAALYFYRVRSDSIMNCSFDLRRCSILEATVSACEFYLEKGEYGLLRYALNAHMRSTVQLCCRIRLQYHGIDKVETIKKICLRCRRDLQKYAKVAGLPYHKRLFYLLFCIIPSIKLAKLVGITV